jgi:hypothetical protein
MRTACITAGVVSRPTPSRMNAIDTTLRMNSASERPSDRKHSASPRTAAIRALLLRPRSSGSLRTRSTFARWIT